MSTVEARTRASDKYHKKFDEIKIRLPKGYKEQIQIHLQSTEDGSMTAFIKRAIDEAMQNDKHD